MIDPRRQVLEVSMTVPLPNLVYLDRVIGVSDPETEQFDVVYLDTADLRLTRHAVTLYRVQGGDDRGWWLEPSDDGRASRVGQPLGRSTRVPAALARRMRTLVRHDAVRRAVTLRTTRTQRRLLDETGAVLATVADDVVRAEPAQTRTPAWVWRQVTTTILVDDPGLADAVRCRLAAAGLQPADAPPVMPRMFAARLPGAVAVGPDTSSGDVLLGYLRGQLAELIREDARARRDEPDAVHRMRVATRRLRTGLATYRPLLDRSRTEPVRDELAWLASVLGAPRDAEVVRDRLRDEVSELAPELVRGPVLARIEQETVMRHLAAHAELVRALDGDRLLSLLDALEALTIEPPLLDAARQPARVGLVHLVRDSCRRVDRRATRADRITDPARRDAALHEVRLAAKRARYAAESAVPAMGRPATRLAEAMAGLQEVLGEYQDSLTARPIVAGLAAAAHDAGEDAFTFGVLYGLERWRGARALERYPRARKGAQRDAVRRWLG